jgi:CRP-like cAMP-binding protein
MDTLPRWLQYGDQVSLPSRADLYAPGDAPGDRPIFYVVAGMVRLEFSLSGSRVPLYLVPDSVFGLVEVLAECSRLCRVITTERTILYRWDLEGFFTAAGVSWELALNATTCLTRELRILNAEFEDRVGTGER